MDNEEFPLTGSRAGDETLAEFIAKDRLKVITHEVGHLTLALALGCPAEAFITPTNTDDPLHEKTWTGSCRINYLCRPRTNREKTMIALAGWLAELLHEKPNTDVYEEVCGFFDEGLSESDLALTTINKRWIVKWAEEVWALLEKYTAFREWAAARLLEHEYISEEEAVEAFPETRKLARYRTADQRLKKRAQDAVSRFRQGCDDTTP